jgi:hypothetical protein
MMHDSIERSQDFFEGLTEKVVEGGKLCLLVVFLAVLALGVRVGWDWIRYEGNTSPMTYWQAFELVMFTVILGKLCSIVKKLS